MREVRRAHFTGRENKSMSAEHITSPTHNLYVKGKQLISHTKELDPNQENYTQFACIICFPITFSFLETLVVKHKIFQPVLFFLQVALK